MHLEGDREGLFPECSAGNLESRRRRLKLKHKWQLQFLETGNRVDENLVYYFMFANMFASFKHTH